MHRTHTHTHTQFPQNVLENTDEDTPTIAYFLVSTLIADSDTCFFKNIHALTHHHFFFGATSGPALADHWARPGNIEGCDGRVRQVPRDG